jgi:hypothetical protein
MATDFFRLRVDYVNNAKVEEDPTVDAFNSTFLSSLYQLTCFPLFDTVIKQVEQDGGKRK